MQKTAFITGVTGQDGAYLAQKLLDSGYRVVGGVRRSSALNSWRLEELGILDRLELHDFDLLDPHSAQTVIREVRPDEVYNLAAQSFVGVSFTEPAYTIQADTLGVLYLLEAIRTEKPDTKFYQASTSEMFGLVQAVPQTEETPFYPRSPYGVAKVAAHWLMINYRESYKIFACSGILFNHESPLRGPEFVTRKITIGMAKIKEGHTAPIELGNLSAKRDWGFAKDYVDGMYRMLQQEKPDDYILATGRTSDIRDFVQYTANALEIDLEWRGEGLDEEAWDKKTGQQIIKVNPKYFRPTEVELLIGDPTKAKKNLDWVAQTDCESLAAMMVKEDLRRVRDGDPLYNSHL